MNTEDRVSLSSITNTVHWVWLSPNCNVDYQLKRGTNQGLPEKHGMWNEIIVAVVAVGQLMRHPDV